MPFSVFVMGIIILVSFATVVAVIYFGSKENVSTQDTHSNESLAVAAWMKRAERASVQMQQALAAAGDAGGSGAVEASEEDDKEARRQAALARKAARAARTGE